jgi:DNA-binding response OmpR family regulator
MLGPTGAHPGGSDGEHIVVDDERDITQILADLLEMRGHDTSAQSGEQALALARQRKFDVAFLDISMPGIDGIETLRLLKKEFPRTIVIMISGVSDEALAIQSIDLGAFDYVRKPFEFSRLDRVVALSLATRS